MPGKVRNCLKCNKRFFSKGAQNRLCWSCNRSNEREQSIKVYRVVIEGKQNTY